MRGRKARLSRTRIAALAIAAGALGSLALAPASYAAAPTLGTNCQNTDGKITGRGSTLQLWLQYDLMGGYMSDICGGGVLVDPTANGGDITDPGSAIYSLPGGETYGVPCAANAAETCDWMQAYNYPSAQILGSSGANAAIGSGAGQTAIGCRAEAFSGTDIPVTSSQLGSSSTAGSIDGPVVAAGGALLGKNCDPVNGATVLTSPFTPQPQGGANGTGGTDFPNPGDQDCSSVGAGCPSKNGVMLFPIGISAVSIYANLPTSCFSTTTPPQLTTSDMQEIWGGTWLTWNQVAGDANSGIVSPCNVSTTTTSAYTLPTAVLEVASITGLPSGGGTFTVPSSNHGTQTLSYTGESTTAATCGSPAPCLTGVSGGTAGSLIASGAEVTSNTALTVTRVVRSDNSGTTQSFDNYVADAFGYSTATCDTTAGDDAVTFGQLQNNQVNVGSDVHWPGLGSAPPGACSAVSDSQGAGGPAQITAAEGISGSVGYADYSDTQHDTNNFTSQVAGNTLSQFGVEASNGFTNIQPAIPGAGIGSSNCTDRSALPTGGASGAVGIAAPGKGWDLTAQSAPNAGPDDIAYADEGPTYPICTLTWDFVWAGTDGNTPPAPTTTGYASGASIIPVSSVAGLPNTGTFKIGNDSPTYTGLGTTAAGCGGGSVPCLTGVAGDPTAVSTTTTLTFPLGTGGAEPNLTPDQRRTLYSYFTYLLSPAAQNTELSAGYAALPTLWQTTIRAGFQAQF